MTISAAGRNIYVNYLDRFHGNLPLALAAYNAGEHAVDRYQALPPIDETRQYVRKVLRYYRTFLTRDCVSRDRAVAETPQAPAPAPRFCRLSRSLTVSCNRDVAMLLPTRPLSLRKI